MSIEYFKNREADWRGGIDVFCSDMWRGFFNAAKVVFPNATLVVDRFHFFGYLNKALDNERKSLRRHFKDREDFKRLKWALPKNVEDLTDHQKKKLARAFLLAPHLSLLYEHKEKFRSIFDQRLTRKQGEIELNRWIEQVNEMKNKHLNNFLYMLNEWKEHVLNYFAHRFTASVIKGINKQHN